MQADDRDLADALEWLRHARSNLARAKADRDLPDVLYEDLCLDAQQAAEKAIKAILVYRHVPFPKTDDIIDLLTLLQQTGLNVPPEIRQADILTEYAVETRYPGMAEKVTTEDYLEAVQLAERVYWWAESLVPGSMKGKGREG